MRSALPKQRRVVATSVDQLRRVTSLRGVERSAALCAVWRWKESAEASPLVLDPFAGELAQEALGTEAVSKLANATFASSLQYLLALRTRLLDDLLIASQRHQPVEQVVQLAVGCDTRALRLGSTSSCRFFEVDTQRMVDFRKRWVQQQRIVQVGFDLKEPELLVPALVDVGFDPRRRTAWLCEGLLEYHEPSFTSALLKALDAAGPQLLILAVLDPYWLEFLAKEHEQRPVRMAWKPSRLPPLEWHRARLAECGWEIQQQLSELRNLCDARAEVGEVKSLFHVLVAEKGEDGFLLTSTCCQRLDLPSLQQSWLRGLWPLLVDKNRLPKGPRPPLP
ncbi:unnamed protein product [Durusdinium trenchii]|uniref:S-adenosyl-L-methionine-dependent methyltransferase n=1 Tax=Durusdinium trenchii TaxID=1381693 RepID=A0ABP0NB19_9DINO